ncbi:Lyso-ornithine lipid O-acyltransferase [Hyphomicrobium sp. 1Nfss2.1]|uniref:lysophospholipid acyltransferase family protein n=1 Tax=Hyphomicrobium sp. 1Nfss2.1 TaxID=3413936 RepID=UPI003C7AF068
MGAFRGGAVLAGFFALTVPLMPVQALLVRSRSRRARTFPHWYHRQVCRLLGIRIKITGNVASDRPVLIIANHTTWLDIPVLSAVAPVSFVAKKEVASWPFVSSLARLQRTVFVDRSRRTAVGTTAGEITGRLARGDTIVLFAEGTSSDGNRVLPFMTSLFAAAKPSAGEVGAAPDAVVQTLSAVYTRLHGLPLGRADRPAVSWFGDMEMRSHAWELLKAGPLDVEIRIGAPVPLSSFTDRKELARHSEGEVRENVVRSLRARQDGEKVDIADPVAAPAAVRVRVAADPGQKWT